MSLEGDLAGIQSLWISRLTPLTSRESHGQPYWGDPRSGSSCSQGTPFWCNWLQALGSFLAVSGAGFQNGLFLKREDSRGSLASEGTPGSPDQPSSTENVKLLFQISRDVGEQTAWLYKLLRVPSFTMGHFVKNWQQILVFCKDMIKHGYTTTGCHTWPVAEHPT